MTQEQYDVINEMVTKRMRSTGEDRLTACRHIAKYLDNRPTPVRRSDP